MSCRPNKIAGNLLLLMMVLTQGCGKYFAKEISSNEATTHDQNKKELKPSKAPVPTPTSNSESNPSDDNSQSPVEAPSAAQTSPSEPTSTLTAATSPTPTSIPSLPPTPAPSPADPSFAIQLGGSADGEVMRAVATDRDRNSYGIFTYANSSAPLIATQTGFQAPNPGGMETGVLSLTPTGKARWLWSIAGAGDDYGYDVSVDDSKTMVVCGTISKSSALSLKPTGSYSADVLGFVALVQSETGETKELRFIDGTSGSRIIPGECEIKNGKVLVSGSFSGSLTYDTNKTLTAQVTSQDAYAGFIVRYSLAQEKLAPAWGISLVGTTDARIRGISFACDGSDASYFTGLFVGQNLSFKGVNLSVASRQSAGGLPDAVVGKIDQAGELVWVQTFGGNFEDVGRGVTCFENNVLVSGSFNDTMYFPDIENLSSRGGRDLYVASLESTTGKTVWARCC